MLVIFEQYCMVQNTQIIKRFNKSLYLINFDTIFENVSAADTIVQW